MEWVDYIKLHWVEIGVVALAFQNFAKAVADTTKTKKDDAIVAKIGSIIGYLFVGKRPQ